MQTIGRLFIKLGWFKYVRHIGLRQAKGIPIFPLPI